MNKTNIKIKCQDGLNLSATLYEPDTIKATVMMAPATGILKEFYHSFATYLSTHGYAVICYENRGIGQSIKGNINKVDASLIHWGKLDMTAVLEKLKTLYPNQSYHVIGHSAGGQLIGLMKNALEVKSLFTFASSSGSLRNMTYPFKLNAHIFMNVFIPLSNFIFNKTNSHWVGMGQPLPKLVGKQWRKWCNSSGYVACEFGKEVNTHLYDDLKLPCQWIYAEDDDIATLKNVNEMARVFSQSKSEIVSINSHEGDSNEIGHMGFFRSKNKNLWHYAINWLNSHT